MTELHATTVGSGPAVMLIHGMGDDSSVWDETAADLADDFACTAVDLPGHGRSPAPDDPDGYRRETVLEAIDAVLERTGHALWAGHSLGGYLALAHHLTRANSRRAVPGMVLVSAGPGFRDAESRQRWNDRVNANAPNLAAAPGAAAIGLHIDSLVIDRLGEVAVPVGLVVGSEDRNFQGANDYMEARLPDVRRTTVEDGRHRVMLTHPGEVASMVRQVAAAAGL